MELDSILLLRVASGTDKVDHPQFFDPPYTLKYLQAGLQQDPAFTVHLPVRPGEDGSGDAPAVTGDAQTPSASQISPILSVTTQPDHRER